MNIRPRELEKHSDFMERFLSSKEVNQEYPTHQLKIRAANELWGDAWQRAQVTVVSSQGDFFINY